MKIAIVGTGYVGLSLATLLSQKHEVYAYDIVKEKIDMINRRISPIKDEYIEKYFKEKKLNLKATLDLDESFKECDYIIICTPTNYDEKEGFFDTSSVESIIERIIELEINATIVIKSTIPVGYVEHIRTKYKKKNIIFSPEFLREGKALYDNLYPSRIIVGDKDDKAKEFAHILKDCSLDKNVNIKLMNPTEAEAVKLFSNTYLALRVSYFNELDTFAELKGLNSKDIIEGVCLDPRIGMYYNNPSFGYGGYCLPKDTKQLLANYKDMPQNVIEAIVKANDTRKKHITNMIKEHSPKVIGVYRLTMKTNSDNFRESAIKNVIDNLSHDGYKIIIYEPNLSDQKYQEYNVINDIDIFNDLVDLVIVNRKDENIKKLTKTIYSRDIFSRD